MNERSLGGASQLGVESSRPKVAVDQIKAIFCMGVGVGASIGLAMVFAAEERYELAVGMAAIALGGGVVSHDELKAAYPNTPLFRKGQLTRYLPPELEGQSAVMRFDVNRGFSSKLTAY